MLWPDDPGTSQRDIHQRKAALEVLLSHQYAADDLLSSPAWQPFCSILPAVLASSCADTAAAAARFADAVFREVRRTSPQQLAQLCIATAAGVGAPASARLAPKPACQSGSGLHAGLAAAQHAGNPSEAAGRGGAAAQAAVLRLLLNMLEALPKVWSGFRQPLMQQLWGAVCPLLRTDIGGLAPAVPGVPAFKHAEQHADPEGSCSRHGTAAGCPCMSSGHAESMPTSVGDEAAGPGACLEPAAGGMLRALCSADEGRGRWWRMWTAPAASARVTS